MFQDIVAGQPVSLMSALDVASAEVDIEYMQGGSRADTVIRSQAAAPFAMTPGEVVILTERFRKSAERQVAI